MLVFAALSNKEYDFLQYILIESAPFVLQILLVSYVLVLPALKQFRVPGEFGCLNYMELGIVCNLSGVRILLSLSNIKNLSSTRLIR